ncbi:thyroid hormone receptor-associated protein 3b isoform X1 [Synchiropus splendidus]|uniref:thyroid hormone receptor-associated protein 3b isoform X1 n=1 Tax=Synchiropus splendidus TaxID=270530 RepID=UPI00237D5BBB|nr:thyroid hormone receptor-associated protein 3b isoform X1 [Synchiropus splendidus]
MSKAADSPVKVRSKSRSKSRTYSRSHSRSQSRSRSRKRHYSSRSRSRSRSHSPSYKSHPPWDYQNKRGSFRGYNRGYRRPFHYRGRNRGYYARGHYQNRGGGGGYGYKSNWHGGGRGGWHDRRRDQDHGSPRRGRSRSRTPRKRSSSHSRSRHTDRSSSGHSRRSSKSSHSRSSSPRRPSNKRSKDTKDKQPDGQMKKSDGITIEKASGGKWIEYDASPKRASPGDVKKDEHGSDSKGSMWRTVGSTSSPADDSPTKSEHEASSGGQSRVSAALKKYMSENKGSKQAADKESSREKDQKVDREKDKSTKSGDMFSISVSCLSDSKEDKTLPFFDPEEEEFLKSHGLKDGDLEEEGEIKAGVTPRDIFGKWGDEPSYSTSYPSVKSKSRRDEDEEVSDHAEDEQYRTRKHPKKEKSKKKEKKEKEKAKRSLSPPSTSRSKDRALFPSAYASSKESPPKRLTSSREDFERKVSSLDEMSSISLSKDHFLSQDVVNPLQKDPEFRSIFQHIKTAQLCRSPSELFAQHVVSILHYVRAQHVSRDITFSERFAMYQKKAAEAEKMAPRKSPEIHRRIDVSPSAFKRHSHLFDDLEEAGYKDSSRKFKGDVMDLRLDIERRKRFGAKESEYRREGAASPEGSRGASREKSSEKSGKHHKKSKKNKKKRDRSPSSSSSSSSPSPSPQPFKGKEFMGEGPGRPDEGYFQARHPPRDYQGPRDHEGQHMERGRGRGFVSSNAASSIDTKLRGRRHISSLFLCLQFPRVRGRGWNRGNYPGNNNSNGNPANMNPAVRPPEEEWDPEYTPKSRKYYLHDDREGKKFWVDRPPRGSFPARRGMGVYRRGGGASPKWTHDMFQRGDDSLKDAGMDDSA